MTKHTHILRIKKILWANYARQCSLFLWTSLIYKVYIFFSLHAAPCLLKNHNRRRSVWVPSHLQTVRFKNELERNITIKLGYANAKIYKCEDERCPRPMSYKYDRGSAWTLLFFSYFFNFHIAHFIYYSWAGASFQGLWEWKGGQPFLWCARIWEC